MWQTLIKTTRIFAAACLLAGFAGCEQADKEDTGGVLLAITSFDGQPNVISVGGLIPGAPDGSDGLVVIESLTLSSIVSVFDSPTSNLMDVEVTSYQVTYTRADRGTRVPAPLVQRVLEYVPVGGSATIINLPILLTPQLNNPPLSDLAFRGIDPETGSTSILLNVTIQFFGRTLSGDVVASNPRTFTVDVRP